MESRELRIGNTVLYEYPGHDYPQDAEWAPYNITSADLADFGDDTFKPIPLTEDWLLRFGFEYWGEFGLRHFELNSIDVVFGHASGSYLAGKYTVYIKHVHQLQNLYFALTQKELILKNK